jgi:hypothetical protein
LFSMARKIENGFKFYKFLSSSLSVESDL